MKKNYKLKLGLALLVLLITQQGVLFDLLNREQGEVYKNLNCISFFENSLITMNTLSETYMSFLVIVIMIMCYGNYIYQDLEISSVYYFTRNPSIIKWFIKRSLSMLIYCLTFVLLYFAPYMTVCAILTNTPLNGLLIYDLIRYVSAFCLYGYFLCTIMNYIALYFGAIKSALLSNLIHVIVIIATFVLRNNGLSYVMSFSKYTSLQFIAVISILALLNIMLSIVHCKKIKSSDIGLLYSEDII